MAHAYTPGLKVVEKIKTRKRRILPLLGDVLAKAGDIVDSSRIVAKTELPGKVHSVNVINKLGISPNRINEYMLKKQGDHVEFNEPIAESKPWLKFLKVVCSSPISGIIETISPITGQILLREKPRPVEICAYIDGKIVETIDKEGVVVETPATFIQGIFGIGGEAIGELIVPVKTPGDVLEAQDINENMRDKIITAGAFIGYEALKKAIDIGVKGIIVGGFDDGILKNILGYDIGVAITGTEDIGITLVITEGFGNIAIAQKTFELLKKREGAKTSINGATQIRAGVVRPEIIIPFLDEIGNDSIDAGSDDGKNNNDGGVKLGDTIRVIRNPHFGRIGAVNALPPEPQVIETGSKMRVLEVKFKDGEVSIVPRANIEAIEQ